MTASAWEWWCASPGGRSAPEKDFYAFPGDIQGAFFDLMEAWLDGSITVDGDSCKSYGQFGVLYLRHQKGNNPYRLYFVQRGDIAVAIHATYKNQQKIDRKTKDLLRARARKGSSKPFE